MTKVTKYPNIIRFIHIFFYKTLLNLCLQVGTSFTANNRRKRPSSALNQSSASSEASASLSKLTTAMVALSNAPLPAAASADQFDTFAQFIAAEMRGCANPAGVRAFKQEVYTRSQ